MTRILSVAAVVAAGFWTAAADPVSPDPHSPRPIEAVDSVFIADLTWMEIRDAMLDGKKTVIIATGGIEQNGPYLVLDKHNVILRGTTEAIARKLGNALVAPIIPFVPEGDIHPPTVHMKYPGSISVREETYQQLLTDICESYRTHGFDHVILIGDSGGNQDGLKAVANRINKKEDGRGHVHYVAEYYDYAGVAAWLEKLGVKQVPEGFHDDFAITAQMMAVDPVSVRMKQRVIAGNFRINGIELAPAEKTIRWGKRIIDYRAKATVAAIRTSIAARVGK